jgi:hypothetical protein
VNKRNEKAIESWAALDNVKRSAKSDDARTIK